MSTSTSAATVHAPLPPIVIVIVRHDDSVMDDGKMEDTFWKDTRDVMLTFLRRIQYDLSTWSTDIKELVHILAPSSTAHNTCMLDSHPPIGRRQLAAPSARSSPSPSPHHDPYSYSYSILTLLQVEYS